MPSLLLIFSDPNLGVVLAEYLRLREFQVDSRTTASEALTALTRTRYDFLLLGLDDYDELLQLTTDIRRISDTPVFVVQNAFHKDEQIALYAAGADDCLAQPLFPDLLVSKMKAMLKRWNDYQRRLPRVFDFPDFHFDSVNQILQVGIKSSNRPHEVIVPRVGKESSHAQRSSEGKNCQSFHLSTKENAVLLLLCRDANQIVERSRILKDVWHSDSYFCARSLSVYINHLRHYLEPNSTLRIISMRTQGYKLLVP